MISSTDDLVSPNLNQGDGLCISRLETNGCSCCDVEAVSICFRAVEFELGIRLDEMVMRTNLFIPLASLPHFPSLSFSIPPSISLYRPSCNPKPRGIQTHLYRPIPLTLNTQPNPPPPLIQLNLPRALHHDNRPRHPQPLILLLPRQRKNLHLPLPLHNRQKTTI